MEKLTKFGAPLLALTLTGLLSEIKEPSELIRAAVNRTVSSAEAAEPHATSYVVPAQSPSEAAPRPKTDKVEYNKQGLPILNPQNIDSFLERADKSKEILVVFGFGFCQPCQEVESKMKEYDGSTFRLATVNTTDFQYLGSEAENNPELIAFANRFGLKEMPYQVPVLSVLKFSGGIWMATPINGGNPFNDASSIDEHIPDIKKALGL